MNEIKINMSIKVWIYILLAVAALFAILMGVSRAVGGPDAIGAQKYHMIMMFVINYLILNLLKLCLLFKKYIMR